jgi:hypothetical protein
MNFAEKKARPTSTAQVVNEDVTIQTTITTAA